MADQLGPEHILYGHFASAPGMKRKHQWIPDIDPAYLELDQGVFENNEGWSGAGTRWLAKTCSLPTNWNRPVETNYVAASIQQLYLETVCKLGAAAFVSFHHNIDHRQRVINVFPYLADSRGKQVLILGNEQLQASLDQLAVIEALTDPGGAWKFFHRGRSGAVDPEHYRELVYFSDRRLLGSIDVEVPKE